jgi:O-antigen/teichoic acid export membrane protein
VLGLILVPGTVLHLMYGEKYATDADALRVFALAALLKFARHVVEVALLALRRQQLLLGAQLGGALALYGFGLVLLPGFGLLGAAVATAASSTVQLGVLVVGLARERRERERGAHHRLIERVPRAAVSGG